ncbi:MAG: hypothetical protein JWQ89_1540 [Devosia sp.]|uniref:DUF3489 domain-containing protein n=1 Tax=Devosia sp. TaxID=1871048 RepID=UPI00262DE17F|nr:DUF3489 domain-containing protein [Devosia sp.]MDB5539813.1 hypothetical protein [Devosia sp.]
MPKLNDTQLILLSTASQREGGSFYPLPTMLADAGDIATKAMAALTKRGFAEQRETSDAAMVARTDGDIRYGMFITDAGIAEIDQTHVIDVKASQRTVVLETPNVSKTSAVLALLQREDGASVSELIELTGWLPHTTRAALTGLRKKGHVIDRSKRNDETCYRIAAAA